MPPCSFEHERKRASREAEAAFRRTRRPPAAATAGGVDSAGYRSKGREAMRASMIAIISSYLAVPTPP
jgi:hypothetical protein